MEFILGAFAGDFSAGLFHWFEDNYIPYESDIPFLRDVGVANKLHHYYPRAMVNSNFFSTIQTTLVLSIIGVGLALLLAPKFVRKHWMFFVSFFFFSVFSNLFHKWSHMRPCELNQFVLFIQKLGIIDHTHHSKHHEQPSEKFCVIFKLSNMILDTLMVFPILESIMPMKKTRNMSYKDYVTKAGQEDIHKAARDECPPVMYDGEKGLLLNNLNKFHRNNPGL